MEADIDRSSHVRPKAKEEVNKESQMDSQDLKEVLAARAVKSHDVARRLMLASYFSKKNQLKTATCRRTRIA